MSYDSNKKVKLGQLETTVGQIKTYVDTQIQAIPADQFLDTAHTGFEYNFAWSAQTYPNSTNPNLDGKAVLVLVLKNESGAVGYSFLDLSLLIDVNKIDKVSGATANNLPKLNADGTLSDSGTALSSVITTADIATDEEVQEMLTAKLGTTAPAQSGGE